MSEFLIKIEPEVINDIQEGINWYNKQQQGLGRLFYAEVRTTFNSIRINPYYQIRYDKVRCLPLKKFPYMVHFSLSEKEDLIIIRGVFNTADSPKKWQRT
ncbi:hypothetical protein RM553_08845 [Zunongwangia sp. F363]|uniref:Type II toxin-antitoxin system RelE/ParE family toxin n=1 Tax=Autumnicola tepida TaxID=3075595 RepID=A0ABU3C9B9_9FLAO|nr:hypothetical protein [Zunongwangia sp. F363]MDT0642936.1 hypothetical protein [Zunongwangia sp. F363]